ncbi:hypothetical protein NFJ02_42g109520 [Pycnococcus provasolii]
MLARAQVAREAGEEEHGNANHAETRELVVRAYGRAMSASIELNHLAAEARAVQRALLVHGANALAFAVLGPMMDNITCSALRRMNISCEL